MLTGLRLGIGISEYVTGEIETFLRGVLCGVAAAKQEFRRGWHLRCAMQKAYQVCCAGFVLLEAVQSNGRGKEEIHVAPKLCFRAKDLVVHRQIMSEPGVAFRRL